MSVLTWLEKFTFFARILRKDAEAEKFLKEKALLRESLDVRLENIARATLDGETEWFLQIAKKDPSCVLRVIKECDTNNGNS